MKALATRFTRVQLPVVQSTLFHERKQKSKEDVDTYAQDIRNLFQKAKTREQGDGGDGKVSPLTPVCRRLPPDLKVKIAGGVGTFDELLAKARLEEANIRVLPTTRQVR